jgi:ADP-ribose pyrophosphatase YjhB (NUDIX family)
MLNYCNNCGNRGHIFNQCKYPITSHGIVAFNNDEKEIKYLLICRKDSLGYVDFIRGKYPLNNLNYLNNIFDEMTLYEKKNILTTDFIVLWNKLWNNNMNIQYRSEERQSNDKFNKLKNGIIINNKLIDIKYLVSNSKTEWLEPEWGFPKGRRNYKETDIICAIREFVEETGYKKHNLDVINNLCPFDELFTGSNYKSYKHRYFVGKINNIYEKHFFQKTEVSNIKWFTFNELIKIIRPYNLEKKDIITDINKILIKHNNLI